MKQRFSPLLIPWCFAILKFIVSIVGIHPQYQLQRDEFLYLAEGRHLAWGFSEVPPLIPFLGRISYELGNSFFMVKFWPALFGAATALLIGAMIGRLGGKWFAQLIAGLAFLLSAFLRIHVLFQPNVLDIFFWTLIAYSLISFFETNKTGWLYIAGISLGLGLLSKYMIAVFVIALFAGLLLTPQRRLLLNKHFWFALVIAFFIFLPNLIWQVQHDFPALDHAEELKETQLQFISPFTFLIQQLLMLVNSVPVWIAGLVFLAINRSKGNFSFFTWTYFILLLLFTLTGGKDYYTLGIYPLLLAAGGVWLETRSVNHKWIGTTVLVLIIVIGIGMIPLLMPFMPPQKAADYYAKTHAEKFGVLEWEDGKNHPLPQDFADMLGWEEMASKTSNVFQRLPDSLKKNTEIYCYNYGEAGALLYYSNQYPFPEILSRSSSFELWYPKVVKATSLIIISDDDPPRSTERVYLNRIQLMDSITNPLARERGSKIYFVGEVKPVNNH